MVIFTWLKIHWRICAVVIIGLTTTHLVTRYLFPRTVTVTKVQTVEHTTEKTVTVEKPVVKWRTRSVTKTVYVPGTKEVASVTTAVTQSGSENGGKETTSTESSKSKTENIITSSSPPTEGR